MNALKQVYRNRELRGKIIITMILLALYRIGYWVQLPGVERNGSGAGWAEFAAMLAASDLTAGSVFGLGIMPYISASIVFQLLGQVVPSLEALQKEGESGRRKINEYTRYATVVVALGQSVFWLGVIAPNVGLAERVALAVVMTSGTMVLVWIGEQIDAFGIGNGISLLIMAGIVTRVPSILFGAIRPALEEGVRVGSATGLERYGAIFAGFAGVVAGVVALGETQRRIPVVSAKDSRRGVQFIPLKLNQAGVMPIIFASSLLMLPVVFLQYLAKVTDSEWVIWMAGILGNSQGVVYCLLYSLLIMFFTYFWTAVSFRPADVADQLRDSGVFVPGFRPGARTEAHLEGVMSRLTFAGGFALCLLAMLPLLSSNLLGLSSGASFFGGTGLMIVVSVAMDFRSRIRSYLSGA